MAYELPIVHHPELCDGCYWYSENDEVDRECNIEGIIESVERLKV